MSTVPLSPPPLMAMTLTPGNSRRRSRISSRPSLPATNRSLRTTSGHNRRNAGTPSLPSPASTTSYPALSSITRTAARTFASSSATRIRMRVVPYLHASPCLPEVEKEGRTQRLVESLGIPAAAGLRSNCRGEKPRRRLPRRCPSPKVARRRGGSFVQVRETDVSESPAAGSSSASPITGIHRAAGWLLAPGPASSGQAPGVKSFEGRRSRPAIRGDTRADDDIMTHATGLRTWGKPGGEAGQTPGGEAGKTQGGVKCRGGQASGETRPVRMA